MRPFPSLHSFTADEGGAVAVDWTVMTASVVGLGLAVIGVVSGGVENLSRSIGGHLTDIEVPGQIFNIVSFDDFEGGLDGWTALIEAHEDPVITGALGPFYDQSGEPVLMKNFSFAEGTEFAVVEFDLTTVGRWEANDDMRLFVDGALIDATRLREDNIQSILEDDSDETAVAYRFIEHRRTDSAVTEQRLEIANSTVANGATRDRDAIRSNVDREADYTVQVVIRNPGTDMDFGVGRNGRSPYPGEAWAIDDFSVEASETDPQAPGS